MRAKITVEKDNYRVPGELLFTYNSTYFSRAKKPPQVQVDEHLYYKPCAIYKRPSNDPRCRCGPPWAPTPSDDTPLHLRSNLQHKQRQQ